MQAAGHNIVAGNDGGGQRHFLDGKAIHAGVGLDLLMPSGQWLPVRYEYGHEPFRARFFIGLGPVTFNDAGEERWPVDDAELIVPENAVFRWPDTDALGRRTDKDRAGLIDVGAPPAPRSVRP